MKGKGGGGSVGGGGYEEEWKRGGMVEGGGWDGERGCRNINVRGGRGGVGAPVQFEFSDRIVMNAYRLASHFSSSCPTKYSPS